MQKWEYMTAQIWVSGSFGNLKGKVKAINGEANKIKESLEQFLSRAGAEGWEVVSSNSNGGSQWVTIILKRHVE